MNKAAADATDGPNKLAKRVLAIAPDDQTVDGALVDPPVVKLSKLEPRWVKQGISLTPVCGSCRLYLNPESKLYIS